MTFSLIFLLTTGVAASLTNSNNVTQGFCDREQVKLTLTIDCDFTGIYVALHHDKADFSTIALQCGQLTCYSFGSMTFRLTNETLEVFFQFQYREHAGRYVNFRTTCKNQTDVLDQVFLKPCLSGFTGNATLVGSDVIIYCEHSSFNESETGIRITDHEQSLATCILGTCLGGHSLPNGAYCQVQYKTRMILLCIIDGAVLNLTNSVIAPTTTPLHVSTTSTQTSTRSTPASTTSTPEPTTSTPESTASTPESTTSTSESTTSTPESTTSKPESITSTQESTTSTPASSTSTPESTTSTRESITSTQGSRTSTQANTTLVIQPPMMKILIMVWTMELLTHGSPIVWQQQYFSNITAANRRGAALIMRTPIKMVNLRILHRDRYPRDLATTTKQPYKSHLYDGMLLNHR
uniref:Uncharacterized protein n=1 Tax=Crassostrea virginica TaxID=6565 RepID=A0A8B8C9H1_CRAVI|nr:putative uncharacterized protein YHR219W isoform X2 [Crassostrea virginica]